MSQDFVRQMPNTGFGSKASFAEKMHLDLPLFILLLLVCLFGLLILYSAVDRNLDPIYSQIFKLIIGFTVMIVLAQIDPIIYMRFAPWLFGIGIFLLIMVLMFGKEAKGSQRWIAIPGLPSFQPSELLKLVIPMMLAWYFHERVLPPKGRHIFWSLFMVSLPVFLIARQPDLGTSLLIGASGLIVLLLAGISWRFISVTLILGALSAPALWSFVLRPYQQRRIMTLLDPESDPLGTGWNIMQSKTAIGSGGLFGKGMFEGTQSRLDFLPESQTDFIVAVLAEERGFVGILVLITLYLLITTRGVVISLQAQDTFGRLLAGSITFTFFVYVFVNVGMVSGILPVVGVPLPLISFGGTSMVTLFAGFGMLMSIHTHRRVML